MTPQSIQLLDSVMLWCDLSAGGLVKSQVGTIVEMYEPGVFEVEFVDQKGYTYALEALKVEQLMLLHHYTMSA
jgi:hypothetical protein